MRFFRNKIAVLIALTLWIGGCSTPYVGSNVLFDDGTQIVSAPDFRGLAGFAQAAATRIIWIHGMCYHDGSWAKARNSIVATAVGQPAAPLEQRDFGGGELYRSHYRVGGHRLQLNFLIWSELANAQRLLLQDLDAQSDELGYRRASLNDSIKRVLLNDCLVDAVTYAGPAGDTIREFAKRGVCRAFGGDMVRRGNRQVCKVNVDELRQTVLVAESLGSKVLLDAIIAIYLDNRGDPAASEAIGGIQSVFLASNQIPILGAATHGTDGGRRSSFDRTLAEFAQTVESARTRSPRVRAALLPPLHIVSFTDPSDVLSYRLNDKFFPTGLDVRLTNVIVSNAPTYFGLVENPLTAHCGYKANPDVLGMIANGTENGRTRIATNVDPGC